MNLSQLLEESEQFEENSNQHSDFEVDDILKEIEDKHHAGKDENISFDSQSIEMQRSINESTVVDGQEIITPLKLNSYPINANTFSIQTSHLYCSNKTSFCFYNQLKLQYQLPIEKVTYIGVKGMHQVLGLESGEMLVYESNKILCKIIEHTGSIIAIVIIESEQNYLQFASSDLDGTLNIITITKKLFRTQTEVNKMIDKSDYPITQLLHHYAKSKQNECKQLLTFGNQVLVVTVQLKPTFKVIHVFEKPKSSIDLHFGKCVFEGQQLEVISIQWNSFIQIVSYVEQNEWYISYYQADEHLIGAKFASQSLMIAARNGGFIVLYTPYFLRGKYFFKNDQRALLNSYSFPRGIYCLRTVKNVLYFLSDSQLYSLQILNWLQQFRAMVSVEHPQWSGVLKFLTLIYNGKVKGLPDLEVEEDQKIIRNLSSDLIKTILSSQYSVESLQMCVLYCISCQLPELLNVIKLLSTQHLPQYYQIMENNIHLIHQLPKPIFVDLAQNFSPESFQKLVINLDLGSIDIGYTYDICLSKNIYTPLIYICPRKEEDFITPLNKMIQAQTPQLNEKCLWFIELTCKQILFPNDTIQIDVWKKAVRQQILWLMEVLDVLICEQLFQILCMFLKHPCVGALDHEDVFIYFQITSINQLPTKIFEKVSEIQLSDNVVHYLLFTSKIVQQLQIKNSDQLLLLIFNYNKQYMKSYHSMPEDFDAILSIIYYLMPHYHLEEQAAEHYCADYLSYCLYHQHKYIEAIDCFFQYEALKLRVYKWLEQQEFQTQYLSRIDELLKLDSEKCAKVLEQWPIETLERLILIEPSIYLLRAFQKMQIEFSPFLQLKLMEMVSNYQPEEIIQWLQQRNFNLDDVEKILQRTENIEGLGYVNEQKGHYTQALKNYLEIYKTESYCYLTTFRNQDRVNECFNHIMRTCKLAVQADDDHQQLYLYVAHNIFNKQMYSSHWCKLKKSFIFNQQFSQLFMALFRYSTNYLISIIELNPEIFNQIQLKSSFISVFKEFSYGRQQLTKILIIIKQDNIILFEWLFHFLTSSRLQQVICFECEKILDSQAILMKCGHSVHAMCLQNKYCTICQDLSVQMLLECINEEENKQYRLKNQDCQQLHLLQSPEQDEYEYDEEQSAANIDIKQLSEMRLMNKLSIFDSMLEESLQKVNSFIDQYY